MNPQRILDMANMTLESSDPRQLFFFTDGEYKAYKTSKQQESIMQFFKCSHLYLI